MDPDLGVPEGDAVALSVFDPIELFRRRVGTPEERNI
jgi:hypothetical protein